MATREGAALHDPVPPPFLSPAARVVLVNAFARPFDNAVATARTCYSARGIIGAAEVAGDHETDPGRREDRQRMRDVLARSIFDAGHHTPLQHAHYQFTLENVSRHFVWSFLHSHPFYNSEQVSQRYVEVKAGTYVVPPLEGEALSIYERACQDATDAYHALIERLEPVARSEYMRLFPARRDDPRWAREVRKKAQEVARYVLPVATFTVLYHTVSGLTLLRYHRLAKSFDLPHEIRIVVGAMVGQMLAHDEGFGVVLDDPIPLEDTPEARLLSATAPVRATAAFASEFDAALGAHVSRLVDRKPGNERCVADGVREMVGLTRGALPDEEAIRWALDPARNTYLGSTLNLGTHARLCRALGHASYTFKKKLSHTADSQEQRHRLTPASRPVVSAHLRDEPDHIVPVLVEQDEGAARLYRAAMERAWEARARLRRMGVGEEYAGYVLPNALAVRYTESADLANLHHRLKLRLCFLAQEEIWRASVDEALQVRAAEPTIGRYLLPPCTLRALARQSPICPEGKRYCGVPAWRLDVSEYRRVI